MTHIVLISDTTLRSFVPPKNCRMTPKSHQICGCELCIIPKDMHIYLKRPRTRIVIYLQQKSVGRHIRNSLFSSTSAAHYKYIFPDGEYLHATIKDAAQCITCLTVKKNVWFIASVIWGFVVYFLSKIFLMKN